MTSGRLRLIGPMVLWTTGPAGSAWCCWWSPGPGRPSSWANHRRLSLRGVGVTPPMVRLHARAVGSAKSGSETTSSQSWVSAWL